MPSVTLQTNAVLPPIERPFADSLVIQEPDQGKSTLKASTKEAVSFQPSKPELPSPLWDVMRNIQALEGAAKDFSLHKEKQLLAATNELNRLHGEETLEIDKALAAQKDVTFWTVLQDIGNIFMGAVSSVLGIFTFSTGNPALGGILIAAGITSIANIAFRYGKVWDRLAEKVAGENRELRETIRTYVPAGIAIACAALSLYTTYQVWNLPGLTSSQQAMAMVETASSLVVGMTELAKGVAGANLQWRSAEIRSLQQKADFTNIDVEKAAEDIQEFHKRQTEINKVVRQLVTSSNDSIQLINQPV